MDAFLAVLTRELRLAARVGAGVELGLVFFLVLIVLVPFAVGPDRQIVGLIAPAVLWLAALLATLLGLDRLVQGDEEEGVIDQFVLADAPLELLLFAKGLGHWLVSGLPLSLAAPLLGVMLAIDPVAMGPLVLSLLIGTPAITFVGLAGAALVVGVKRGGLLIAVLILPLTVPTLIFGVSVVKEAVRGASPATPLLLLLGTSLAAVAIGPVAAAAALRSARD